MIAAKFLQNTTVSVLSDDMKSV